MKMSRQDRVYYVKEYGLKKAYLMFCNFIKWLSCFVTLLLIPVSLGSIIYYSYVVFSPLRVIVSCAILYVVVDVNSKI